MKKLNLISLSNVLISVEEAKKITGGGSPEMMPCPDECAPGGVWYGSDFCAVVCG